MRTPELVVSTEPAPGEVQYLEDRLYEFNSAATGITDGEWLAIFVRDDGRTRAAEAAGIRTVGLARAGRGEIRSVRRPSKLLDVACDCQPRVAR